MAKRKLFTVEDLKKSKAFELNIDAIDRLPPKGMMVLFEQTGALYYKSMSINEYRLLINPRGKPRMVRSDAWKKRKVVTDYWAWKAALLKEAQKVRLSSLPSKFKVTFHMQMPDSWSKSKKALHDGKPHQTKSDIDNLLKALQDCLCKEDSHIHDVHAIKKWAYNGWIKIEI
jgi:Holliday junction resolvase RusA-like endonuclease